MRKYTSNGQVHLAGETCTCPFDGYLCEHEPSAR
ncbi:SWIM zinc finger family protein [Corynebacterium xerosis]